MRWESGRRSQNVDDIRGQSGQVTRRGGFGIPLPSGSGKRKGGCSLPTLLMLLFLAYVMGFNPLSLLTGSVSSSGGSLSYPTSTDTNSGFNYPSGQSTANSTNTNQGSTVSRDQVADFISVVKGYNEDVWSKLLSRHYYPAKLKIFSNYVNSGCGPAQSDMGPFYCPSDQSIYIDPSFFQELRSRHNAPGDFAQAYVISHEVGHHIQTLLGISDQVRQLQSRYPSQKNELSIRQELNADCLAGVWAHHADLDHHILEDGDVEEAVNAANAIGDDTLQKRMQGFVIPHSFTHGTSQQRMRWLNIGLKTGDINSCNTFEAKNL